MRLSMRVLPTWALMCLQALQSSFARSLMMPKIGEGNVCPSTAQTYPFGFSIKRVPHGENNLLLGPKC